MLCYFNIIVFVEPSDDKKIEVPRLTDYELLTKKQHPVYFDRCKKVKKFYGDYLSDRVELRPLITGHFDDNSTAIENPIIEYLYMGKDEFEYIETIIFNLSHLNLTENETLEILFDYLPNYCFKEIKINKCYKFISKDQLYQIGHIDLSFKKHTYSDGYIGGTYTFSTLDMYIAFKDNKVHTAWIQRGHPKMMNRYMYSLKDDEIQNWKAKKIISNIIKTKTSKSNKNTQK